MTSGEINTETMEKAKEEAEIKKRRSDMDTACGLLSDAHQSLKDRCNEFEALLDVPTPSLSAIRQAQTVVRTAGVRSMSLTTSYLASLSAYMKAFDH